MPLNILVYLEYNIKVLLEYPGIPGVQSGLSEYPGNLEHNLVLFKYPCIPGVLFRFRSYYQVYQDYIKVLFKYPGIPGVQLGFS